MGHPPGTVVSVSVRLDWHFNDPSLVERRSISVVGWPWAHFANAFAREYDYSQRTLPMYDKMARRGGPPAIGSCLTRQDVGHTIKTSGKVA